jgi:hypothetical protein
MSREQLIDLYLRGQIGRRTFIRRLVGAGISLTAAATYAELLVPQPAFAARGDYYWHYPGNTQSSANDAPPSRGSAAGQPAGRAAAADTAGPALGLTLAGFRLDDLVALGAIPVELSSDEAATVELNATLTVSGRRARRAALALAKQTVRFDAAGGQSARLPLTSQMRTALKTARRATVTVSATATDGSGNATTSTVSASGSA